MSPQYSHSVYFTDLALCVLPFVNMKLQTQTEVLALNFSSLS